MGLSVLRVSERIPPFPGGKEVHVAELTLAQTRAGHDVRVLYRAGDGSRLAAPATAVTLPPPLAGVGGLAGTALFAAAGWRRAARFGRPDIVHAHGDLTEAWCLTRHARRVGAAMVLTVHGGLNPRYARLSGPAFAGVDAFIAIGERVHVDLRRCGVSDSRVTVMSSGVNPELIAAASHVRRQPGLVVVVGSLDPVKNVDTVIRAALDVPEWVGLTVEIIGGGPLRDRLAALAGRSPRIRFRGQLTRPEVYRRIAAADAFVIASRRLPGKGEGVPTALLEAMALGRLALVSTAASPRPVVTDDASYRVFDPGDRQRLTELLVAAVTDHGERERIGGRARAAVASLGWPQVAERVGEVYHRALVADRAHR
jgi:glycosyltransferase involved in cell wall biosynthesis